MDDHRDFKLFRGICDDNTVDGSSNCPVTRTLVGYLFCDVEMNADNINHMEERHGARASNNIYSTQHERETMTRF